MKEASGEVSMTLIVIVAAAVILGIVYALSPTIRNSVTNMWKEYTGETQHGINVGRRGT